MVTYKEDTPMNGSESTGEQQDQDANKAQKRNSKDGAARSVREQSVDMLDEGSDRVSLLSSPINAATIGSHTIENAPRPDLPSVDDQIDKVHSLVSGGWLEEGVKGFAISCQWLARVMSRSSNPEDAAQLPKEAREGAIGPVDNGDIWLDVDGDTKYEDEKGETFVFLQPHLRIGQDYEMLPQEAWDLIVEWYTLAQGSPVITRYYHNTSTNEFAPNMQWEQSPPIFTLLKLPDTSSGLSQKDLKERQAKPVKILASRTERVQTFLKRAKEKTNIDKGTKTRVWRIIGGLGKQSKEGILTPAQSRSNSPAPGAVLTADPGDKLVLDVNQFAQLQVGAERELLDVKDETANSNYNGKSTLSIHGLISDGVYLLEEMIGGPAGGEWVSDGSTSKARANGVAISVTKSGTTSVRDSLKPNASASRGTSPGPTGVMTRGRQARMGKSRGTIGLHNLGNTCYMNSALQCVRSVEELTEYFLRDSFKAELNPGNPLAHNGEVAKSYARLLHEIYDEKQISAFTPRQLKNVIGKYGPSFSGYQQQDSQEFLLFLLDGLQEDLNRIHKKPYIEKPDSTDEMVGNPAALQGMADQCWEIYKKRNDSVITDLFAGMYKSTLVCPHCDKVSIIFDPFNNLTLQLPIQNIWSKNIWVFPRRSPCFELAIDIDKNSTWSQLASYVANKLKMASKKLMFAEIWQHKLYKIFEAKKTISEDNVADGDQIGCFEIENTPTNWPAPKKSKKSFSMYAAADDEDIPDGESPLADNMLVSMFHRRNKTSRFSANSKEFFALPSLMTVTREESRDYPALVKKCLSIVETMTTRNFLNEDDASNAEDSDTVLLNTDDSSDGKTHEESLESEDGMVDISMTDDATRQPKFQRKPLSSALKAGQPLPVNVDSLFAIKTYAPGNEMVPLGFQSFMHDENKKLPTIASRVTNVAQEDSSEETPTNSSKYQKRLSKVGDSPEISDEDEDKDLAPHTARPIPSADDEASDDDDLPPIQQLYQDAVPASSSYHASNRTNTKVKNTYSKKDRRKAKTPEPPRHSPSSETDSRSSAQLLRLGECIVLDWTDQGYDALFGSTVNLDDEEGPRRGQPTFENPDVLPDPELEEKRRARALRKKHGVSLNDCLDEFGKSEILSENDAWYCPRCKEHQRASKTLELWKAPDILVIHLKRFSSASRWGRNDKLDIMVDFPLDDLDLTSRLASSPDPNNPPLYELFAVDNHYGGLGGGHYTACAKNFIDKQWYDYNGMSQPFLHSRLMYSYQSDSMVSSKKPESVITSAAYLLFYRRKSETTLGGPFFEKICGVSPPQSQSNSRAPSPTSGEGKRLENSSRNGLSSAFPGAGAGHQVGGGGLGDQAMADADALPSYKDATSHDELDEGIGMGDDDTQVEQYQGPYNYQGNEAVWSFDHLERQGLTNSPVPRQEDNDSLGANSNGSNEARIHALGEDPLEFGTPEQRPLETDEAGMGDSIIDWDVQPRPDPPVAEIKVSEDEVEAEHTSTNMKLD